MNCFFICDLLLVFLLVYGDSANSSQENYYITPSLSVDCPGDPCLTLAQLAANSASYLGNETNTSLSFLPGNHSLDGELSFSHADNFSMTKVTEGNGTVFVECGSRSGRLNISETTFVTIKGMHFIGCSDNRISQVEWFVIEDTIFQGVEGRGTALVLNEVTAAFVERSSFLSNTHGSTFLLADNITSNPFDSSSQDILNHALDPNSSLAAGGALYTVFSNVSIVNSKFTDNMAEIGGAIFAHKSSLHVVGSTYSNNRAGPVDITKVDTDSTSQRGGVMFISDSSFRITNSTFTNNTAAQRGGVIVTVDSSFNITNSIFTNNSAGSFGGVVCMSGSLFDITSTTFASNSALYGGGAVEVSNSSLYITSSTFTDNSAVGGFGQWRI